MQGMQQSQQSQQQVPQKSAAQIEAERVEAVRQAALAAEREQERQAKKDAQVAPMIALLAPLPATSAQFNQQLLPAAQPRPASVDFTSTVACNAELKEQGKQYACHVVVCGGSFGVSGGTDVCCPEGYPILNECECTCYKPNSEFECKRYAACQYSTEPPPLPSLKDTQ